MNKIDNYEYYLEFQKKYSLKKKNDFLLSKSFGIIYVFFQSLYYKYKQCRFACNIFEKLSISCKTKFFQFGKFKVYFLLFDLNC